MNEHPSQKYENIQRDRVNMYNLLARLYRQEVDSELLEEMQSLDFDVLNGDQQISQGYRLLRGYLFKVSEISLIDLAADYTRIFIGPDRNGAYPYESVYTSPDRLLMQEARDQVVAIYRQAGLQRSDEFFEPEDHLAFELEYMAYEIESSIEAYQNGDLNAVAEAEDRQKYFLKSHLLNWVPDFAADVQRKAKTDFYSGVALITVEFLESDWKYLNAGW